ncbi:hypothetical protein JOD52_001733 [Brachybacterium muris]|uniref:hypothetical protein n=1 Tax=Brachybacterium muris TaxID=219301 RepID=UPI0019565040|nr:hypothetical protein [Brachybacterium muris]MBM7500893.1 hypothetical protein [Brachybacterium muris]
MLLSGSIVFLISALLLILTVRVRARRDPGTRERRKLEPQGMDVWCWFADFERRGGRVQDTETLEGVDAMRASSIPWRVSSRLILLMAFTYLATIFIWGWWVVPLAVFIVIGVGGALGEFTVRSRDREAEGGKYRGSGFSVAAGLLLKIAVLCLAFLLLRAAAALLYIAPVLPYLLLVALLILLAVVLIDRAHLPARAVEARIRRMRIATFADNTPESAILYLRSFDDDTARIYSPLSGTRWYEPLLPHRVRFEELLEGWTYGEATQLVAIGRPGEPIPSLGAHRSYWTDDSWQEAVRRTAVRCRAVILVAGTSEGLGWEISQLSQMGMLGKTLLVLPPDTPERSALRYRTIASATGRPNDPFVDSDLALASIPAISYTEHGELVHYISFGRDWAAFATAEIHKLRTLAGKGSFERSGNLSQIVDQASRVAAIEDPEERAAELAAARESLHVWAREDPADEQPGTREDADIHHVREGKRIDGHP